MSPSTNIPCRNNLRGASRTGPRRYSYRRRPPRSSGFDRDALYGQRTAREFHRIGIGVFRITCRSRPERPPGGRRRPQGPKRPSQPSCAGPRTPPRCRSSSAIVADRRQRETGCLHAPTQPQGIVILRRVTIRTFHGVSLDPGGTISPPSSVISPPCRPTSGYPIEAGHDPPGRCGSLNI